MLHMLQIAIVDILSIRTYSEHLDRPLKESEFSARSHGTSTFAFTNFQFAKCLAYTWGTLMIVIESYSYFNGLEFLKVHRNDFFNELKQLVKELDAVDVGTVVPNSLAPYVHRGSGNQRHRDRLEARDWHYSSSARIECFNKRRIGLKFCFDLKIGEERSEFNDFCSRYRSDEIDVGIGLFPMERTERDIGSADFRTAIQTLKDCGRAGAVVPLALFAIGA